MDADALAAKAHAFVVDVERPELADADRHHLARVLRLRPGDPITVADGAGAWRACSFGDPLEPVGPVRHDDTLRPEITIAFALVKGNRPELVVQKLTEIGVDHIVPFVAERSIVRWDDDKVAHHNLRLTTVAREAAMQSRRSRLPSVGEITTFAAVAQSRGAAMADLAGAPPSLTHPVVLIGPEGGWSDAERQIGLHTMRLGPTVLRAETAAIVAGAALCGLRSGLMGQVDDH